MSPGLQGISSVTSASRASLRLLGKADMGRREREGGRLLLGINGEDG